MIVLFILGALLLTAAISLFFAKAKTHRMLTRIIPALVLATASLVMITVSCMRTVPTGHTGIITVFGRVEDATYEAGVHFTAPWKSVINMDNRNQKASVDLACFSSDIQEVQVTYTLNYQISKTNAQTIYKDIGVSYYETIIMPQVQAAVKSELAKYTAEQLLSNRSQLSEDIRNVLTNILATYNIVVVDAAMENLDFSDAFTDAVEAKQVAEQKSKQAKIEQEQKTMEAEAAAQRAKIEAEAAAERAKIEVESEAQVAKIAADAELDVAKIKAEAATFEGQKAAALIEKVRDVLAKDPENLTDEDINNLLVYYYVEKWNGELPSTYIGAEDFYELIGSLAGNGGTNP